MLRYLPTGGRAVANAVAISALAASSSGLAFPNTIRATSSPRRRTVIMPAAVLSRTSVHTAGQGAEGMTRLPSTITSAQGRPPADIAEMTAASEFRAEVICSWPMEPLADQSLLRAVVLVDGAGLFAEHEEVEAFDLLPGPGGAAQKLQARGDAGIALKAADVHLPAKLVPAEMGDQLVDDHLEGDPVKGVAGLRGHGAWLRSVGLGAPRRADHRSLADGDVVDPHLDGVGAAVLLPADEQPVERRGDPLTVGLVDAALAEPAHGSLVDGLAVEPDAELVVGAIEPPLQAGPPPLRVGGLCAPVAVVRL